MSTLNPRPAVASVPEAPPAPVAVHRAPTGEAGGAGKGAWFSRSAWMALLVVTLLSIVVDLASKHLAFYYVADKPLVVERTHVLAVSAADPRMVNSLVPQHAPMVVLPKLLHFTLVLNPGAVFGIGPGQRWFFIAFTVVALAFGLLMFAKWTAPRDRWAHAAIGLLIGGGLGNLYDRLTYGCVRDFIHPLPDWKWPSGSPFRANTPIWPYVSNVADLLLLIGIAILLIHLWRKDRGAVAITPLPTPTPAPATPPDAAKAG